MYVFDPEARNDEMRTALMPSSLPEQGKDYTDICVLHCPCADVWVCHVLFAVVRLRCFIATCALFLATPT